MATAVLRRSPPEVGGQFRVLIGAHLGDGPKGCECDACLKSKGKNHVYESRLTHQRQHGELEGYDNDIIDSPVDLELRHNRGNSRKFERVNASEAQEPKSFPLEKMTLAQLMNVAADEEVAIDPKLSKKEDVLKVLREAGV